MQVLKIDQALFRMAFDRDKDFHDAYWQSTYLDLQTGDVFWVYEDDEQANSDCGIPASENKEMRECVSASPGRYLEIPGFNHGKHHDILQDFLASDWTDDEVARSRAQAAYFGSIGGWKEAVKDETIIFEFYEFRDNQMEGAAEKFLRQHGIEPKWV